MWNINTQQFWLEHQIIQPQALVLRLKNKIETLTLFATIGDKMVNI